MCCYPVSGCSFLSCGSTSTKKVCSSSECLVLHPTIQRSFNYTWDHTIKRQKPSRQLLNQVIKIRVISKWTVRNRTTEGMQWAEPGIISTLFLLKAHHLSWIMGEHHRDATVGHSTKTTDWSRSWKSLTVPNVSWPFMGKRKGILVGGALQEPNADGGTHHALSASTPPCPQNLVGPNTLCVCVLEPCPFLASVSSGRAFYCFWTLWYVTSNWTLTSDFLSVNLDWKSLFDSRAA